VRHVAIALHLTSVVPFLCHNHTSINRGYSLALCACTRMEFPVYVVRRGLFRREGGSESFARNICGLEILKHIAYPCLLNILMCTLYIPKYIRIVSQRVVSDGNENIRPT
jgi:hypothetical protein